MTNMQIELCDMVLATNIDRNLGLSFDEKRQSRDRYMISNLVEKSCISNKLLITQHYSNELFLEYGFTPKHLDDLKMLKTCSILDKLMYSFGTLYYIEETLKDTTSGGIFFYEGIVQLEYINDFNELWTYDFNRIYPADLRLDKHFFDIEPYFIEEIEGFSHDRIILEKRILNECKK